MHFNVETYRRTFSIYLRLVLIKRHYFYRQIGSHNSLYKKNKKKYDNLHINNINLKTFL